MSQNSVHKLRRHLNSATFHAGCLFLSLVVLYPVLWLVSSSFKESSQIFMQAESLIPKQFTLRNYINGWRGFGNTTFATFFANSILISIAATIGEVISCTLAAYAFARIRFVGRRFWFACMLSTIMLPFQIIMIPQYILFKYIRWTSSFKPLVIPHYFAITPFFVFLLMQFIRGIPKEMDDAATVDGCNRYDILFRIIVPLILPALATVIIFSFYWRWQDFLRPLLFLSDVRKYPISIALKMFSDPSTSTDWGAIFAMGTLSLFPVALVFFIFQRYIIEGISTSGLKG